MRHRDERGASLAWAMLVLAAVSTAIAVSGGAIASRMRCARLAAEAGALQDLDASGVALGRLRAADPGWLGPEAVELAGGTVSVRLVSRNGRATLIVESTARLTGRVAESTAPLDLNAPPLPPPQPLGLTARY